MFIIIATKGNWKWISGVFQAEEVARQYMDLIPDELKAFQEFIQIENITFPFYIIERQASPFRFLDKDEVISLFDHTDISEDEDEVHFNIYTVDSDYRPKKPGTDYMGILRHDHVTNEWIEMYREEGAEFLIRRRIL
ncbi:hypothetical protein CQ043_01675 [Paenibacillus sp. MYb63]|uniref:hypothetical protein n=1 Tax=Paenibacillus sp. MYb63 TaxID=1848709 RepID=UPI000CFDB753|nr:hypothetical protein [Paenibacillus sp. MYb63]PRA08716.1 hypothetical protein CQ043_01675 [Paenibacillus sp. MYb63]PRA48650.1 hypothetical protein CQ061_10130 [Paenibacillus sp. MYb67]